MTHSVENDVAPWDVPWTFTVTWDTERGVPPSPILRLFPRRATVEPGRAVHRTDKGHSTYYVRAVQDYVQKYCPERTDIAASASEARVIPPEGRRP